MNDEYVAGQEMRLGCGKNPENLEETDAALPLENYWRMRA